MGKMMSGLVRNLPLGIKEFSPEKTLMLGKCEGKRRKGTTEDEMDGQGH